MRDARARIPLGKFVFMPHSRMSAKPRLRPGQGWKNQAGGGTAAR